MAPDPVYMYYRQDKSFAPSGIQTPEQSVACHHTDYAIPAPRE